ncbi:MAG: aminotransferase class I/II-fold pyridoxal phosphate-dependent enzyme [Bacteroidota bacterium]
MILEKESLVALRNALEKLENSFSGLPSIQSSVDTKTLERVLLEVADRLGNNYPYFHPLYAGQMLKPPHPIARLAYTLALWINPNNHALDGGRASSAMEKEAVAEIARMFGWETHLGHLCSGGTMANLEALWIAGKLQPGKMIVASEQAHYTHERISGVLGLPFLSIPSDAKGRLDLGALKAVLEGGKVGTVVATIGTTSTGSVDPLPELLELRKRYGFRLHADAAYGGYFVLANNLSPSARQAYDRIAEADSIVVDPHKHGLQPYGCGCVLFHDPAIGRLYKHDSPYTYFSSGDLHLGEISLECSRPGAAAVALWATQKMLPLTKGGEFARMLQESRTAATELYGMLARDKRFVPAFEPELDIVVWLVRSASASEASERARRVFDEAAKRDLHLALATLPVDLFQIGPSEMVRDQKKVVCLRSVLMKPEHHGWLDQIWQRLSAATEAALVAPR